MSETVAKVNGAPITENDVKTTTQSLAREQFRTSLDQVPEENHESLRQMAIDRLVARELIYQAALGEGVVATEEEIEAEQSRIIRMMGEPENFWGRLAEAGMDEAAFLRMVRKDVTVDRMTSQKVEEVPEPNDEEIEAFYRSHSDKLKSPERCRVSHILIPTDPDDPDQAKQTAERLKVEAQKADFAELARRNSTCPSAPGGGDLGYIRREDVDQTFADTAFALPVDEIGGPVLTSFGYHLIKVLAREVSAPLTLDEARPQVVNFIKRDRATALLEEWVEQLRLSATVEVVG